VNSKSVNFSSGQFHVSVRRMASWFDRQKRVLPWRENPTVYRVWVSEIMLQQTQVATVIPYFERFMARFPTLETLAEAPIEDVLRLWAGLGYYSRARNLHRAARTFASSGFPETREQWLEVPGVGPYTAGAILSIALDQPEPILDGNVERVISRIRRTSDKGRLWRLARAFVETAHRLEIRPSVANQSMMELGATICTPTKPNCGACPLFDLCRACAEGDTESFPERKKSKDWLSVKEELHCIVDSDGRILLRERAPDEWRAGLWDFLDNSDKETLKKTGGKLVEVGSVQTRHIVTRHKILRTTHIWKAGSEVNIPGLRRWISVSDPQVAVGSALRRALRRIRERFPEVLQ